MDGTRIRLLGALAGVTLVTCVLSGCSASGGIFTAATAAPDIFAIVVGNCLDDGDAADQVTSVPIVDCAQPHDSEVFARTLASGTTFPGGDDLEARLTAFCQGEVFTEFVGVTYEDSAYFTGGYYPTPASWASGDRELLCTVRTEGAKTTGTLRDAEAPAPTPTPTP